MERPEIIEWQTAISRQNPELLTKAQEELNENPATRNQEIQKFRDMVLADKDLKCPTDELFLLRFLRPRKFDHERALKLLRKYFSIRLKYPEVFTPYRPSSMRHVLNQNVEVILPQCDQLGRKILLIVGGRWDPKIASVEEHLRFIHMCLEHALRDEAIQVHGMVGILDLQGVGIKQIREITPSNAKKVVSVIQDCLPLRIKGINVMYEPLLFDVAYQVMKLFLNKKIKSRVFLHGDSLESLHKNIHPEHLPEDYGGLLPPIDFYSTNEALLAKDDEIAEEFEKYGYVKE